MKDLGVPRVPNVLMRTFLFVFSSIRVGRFVLKKIKHESVGLCYNYNFHHIYVQYTFLQSLHDLYTFLKCN